MSLKPFLFLVLVCIGCQTGRIPCPKVKGVRLQTSNARRAHGPVLSARAEESKEASTGSSSRSSIRYIKNVDIEEWDCPEPGSRKLMPKKIRDNIRRNAALINEEQKRQPSDTLSRQ